MKNFKIITILLLIFSINVFAEEQIEVITNGGGETIGYSNFTPEAEKLSNEYKRLNCNDIIDWSGETTSPEGDYCDSLQKQIDNLMKEATKK